MTLADARNRIPSERGAMFNRKIQVTLWAAMAVLLASAGWRVYAQAVAPPLGPTGAYTVVLAENSYDQAGALKDTHRYIEARRSDGAKLKQMVSSRIQERNIYLADGSYIRTNDLTGGKSTYPRPLDGTLPPRRDPERSYFSAEDQEIKSVLKGMETIGGYSAARIEMKQGGQTWTMWFAPALGCAQLQQRVEVGTSVTEQRLESILVGEPDPALFRVAETVKEMPPSQYYATLPAATSERLDRNYRASRGE